MTKRGPKPKDSAGRARVQAYVSVHADLRLRNLAEASGTVVSDLGAYFLLVGMNAERKRFGFPPEPIPQHLIAAAVTAASEQDTMQDALLAS